jgi:hypothetical protein
MQGWLWWALTLCSLSAKRDASRGRKVKRKAFRQLNRREAVSHYVWLGAFSFGQMLAMVAG